MGSINNKKTVERARMRVELDEESLPSQNKINKLIAEIREKYKLTEDKVDIVVEKTVCTGIEIMIHSQERDLPIVAAVEMFMMKIGNVVIRKKVLEYKNVL